MYIYIYTCTWKCIYLLILHVTLDLGRIITFSCIRLPLSRSSLSTHLVHAHIYIYTHIYTYICICTYICIHDNIYIYICIHIYIYTYIFSNVHMYICSHILTQVRKIDIYWLMIAFITWNSNLVSLLEGLCTSNPCHGRFKFSVSSSYYRNRTDDLGIDSPALLPTELIYIVSDVICIIHAHIIYILELCHGGRRWDHVYGAQGTREWVIDTRRDGETPGWSLIAVY